MLIILGSISVKWYGSGTKNCVILLYVVTPGSAAAGGFGDSSSTSFQKPTALALVLALTYLVLIIFQVGSLSLPYTAMRSLCHKLRDFRQKVEDLETLSVCGFDPETRVQLEVIVVHMVHCSNFLQNQLSNLISDTYRILGVSLDDEHSFRNDPTSVSQVAASKTQRNMQQLPHGQTQSQQPSQPVAQSQSQMHNIQGVDAHHGNRKRTSKHGTSTYNIPTQQAQPVDTVPATQQSQPSPIITALLSDLTLLRALEQILDPDPPAEGLCHLLASARSRGEVCGGGGASFEGTPYVPLATWFADTFGKAVSKPSEEINKTL